MGQLLRIRISLVDRAGALAQAATVIGLHGGNIISIDVHRTDTDSAVDDLVVEFSTDPDLDALRDDLVINAATALIAHEPADATDPVVATIRRAAELFEASSADRDKALASLIADMCSSPAAWVCSADEALRYEAGRLAVEGNRAVKGRTGELPDPIAELVSGEVTLLAVPDLEASSGGRVIFVARPPATEFTATEIARIEAMSALQDHIDSSRV